MTTLPSLADALLVIILLIPGFISLTLIRWFGAFGSKLSEFQATIGGFIFSMLILFLYTSITGFTDIDQIRDNFFNPKYYALLFGLAIACGTIIGISTKIWRRNHDRLDPWKGTITKCKKAPWLIVITKDGSEYKGIMTKAGIEEERSIIISNPVQIVRDDFKVVKAEIPYGLKLLFKEEDIARIMFLS